MIKRIFMVFLVCILMLQGISACGTGVNTVDLMKGISARDINAKVSVGDKAGVFMDFAVKVLQQDLDTNENQLISPMSILCALSMLMNGAEGKTKLQMETSLGFTSEEINEYLSVYLEDLKQSENSHASIANSIWLKKGINVKKEFLQINADYYGADIYSAEFNHKTLSDINKWVENNTNGMIKNMLSEIPAEAVMYIINALAFESEWENEYKKAQIKKDIFKNKSGTEIEIDFMHSEEHIYIESEEISGFIKYYADRKFAFAAILPEESISVSEYIGALTGEKMLQLLENAQDVKVNTAMPKFKSEYSVRLNEVLEDIGIKDAFNAEKADFKAIAEGDDNIYVNQVLHKTYIEVAEKGTRAGAATAVEMNLTAEMIENEVKEVILDRPFIYMIIDCNTNLPLFVGIMEKI